MLTLPLLTTTTSGCLSTPSLSTQRICSNICVSCNFLFIFSFAENFHPSDLEVHETDLIDVVHGKCQEFHWDINGISSLHVHFLSTVESFVSPTINIYNINVSSDFWSVMAATLNFHLKPKINFKKISNIMEINIMEDFILVSRRIDENYLLVDLDLGDLNPQDPTRICWCLRVRSLQRCSSHWRKKIYCF